MVGFRQLGSRIVRWMSFSNRDNEPAYNDREVTEAGRSDTCSAKYKVHEPIIAEVCDMFQLKRRETPTVNCAAKDRIPFPPELDSEIVSAEYMAEAQKRILRYCVGREVEEFRKALGKRRAQLETAHRKTVLYAIRYRGEEILLELRTDMNLWHEDSRVSRGAVITGTYSVDTDPVVDCVLGMAITLRLKNKKNAIMYGAVMRDGVVPVLLSLDTKGNLIEWKHSCWQLHPLHGYTELEMFYVQARTCMAHILGRGALSQAKSINDARYSVHDKTAWTYRGA